MGNHDGTDDKTRLPEKTRDERRNINFPPHTRQPPLQMKYQQELAFISGI
jgi:hypothetical protein